MKKLILGLLFVGVLVGGYMYVSIYARVGISLIKGETKPATRGDLVVPITASGTIQPASIRKIKSKASGRIDAINFKLGARVKEGDLLVELQKVDEQRAYDRAMAEQHRAEFALQTAQISLLKAKTTAKSLAQAKLADAKAQLAAAESRYKFVASQTQPSDGSPGVATLQEWDAAVATRLQAKAAVDMAQANLDDTDIAVKLAEQDVNTANEAVNAAKQAAADANQRLIETSIFSPIDGMVLARPMQVGEITQGGTMTLMGGSELIHVADISDIFAVVNVDEADIGQVHNLAPASARPGTATQPSEGEEGADGAKDGDTQRAESAGEASTQPTTQTIDIGQQGQIVKVKVEAFPDEDFDGIITQISPQSEMVAAVATFKVWIRIVSPNRSKLVGLLNTQTEARFTSKSVHNAVLVPYDAVQKDPAGEGYGVYVPRKNATTGADEEAFVKCKLGKDNGTDVEVREGIEEGQLVYTKRPLKRDDKK